MLSDNQSNIAKEDLPGMFHTSRLELVIVVKLCSWAGLFGASCYPPQIAAAATSDGQADDLTLVIWVVAFHMACHMIGCQPLLYTIHQSNPCRLCRQTRITCQLIYKLTACLHHQHKLGIYVDFVFPPIHRLDSCNRVSM